MRVGINGMGRMGRLALRAAMGGVRRPDSDPSARNRLDVVHLNPGTTRDDNWIIVTMPDESGAGLKFGIVIPIASGRFA